MATGVSIVVPLGSILIHGYLVLHAGTGQQGIMTIYWVTMSGAEDEGVTVLLPRYPFEPLTSRFKRSYQ